MTAIERIKELLAAEEGVPEKDNANIYNPNGIDSSVRKRVLNECISVLEKLT